MTALARSGDADAADALLDRLRASMPETGLLAEEIEPATGRYLGNVPMIFSHAEFVRASVEAAKARPLQRLRLMGAMVERKIERALRPASA